MEILLEDLMSRLLTLAVYIIILIMPAYIFSKIHPVLTLVGLGIGFVVLSMVTGFWFILWIAMALAFVAIMKMHSEKQ